MSTATEEPSRSGTRSRSTTSTASRERAAGRAAPPVRTRPAPAGPAPRRRPSAGPASRAGTRPQPGQRAPRMPFVLLILGLLGGALVSLLALRTVLIEDAFAISRLQQENRQLAEQEEALREQVIHLESPEEVAKAAEELGMEPGDAPLFLDLETGEVTGGAGQSSAGAR